MDFLIYNTIPTDFGLAIVIIYVSEGTSPSDEKLL